MKQRKMALYNYHGTADFVASAGSMSQTIQPAVLTITADDKSKLYWTPLPAFTASYSGFVNGDTLASLTTLPTLATPATAHSPVGWYDITGSGAASPNYTISYVKGTLAVTDCGWQNPVNQFDVTGEGDVTPLDALQLINYINVHPGDPALPAVPASPPPFYDVKGDQVITPLDVLLVINYINARPVSQPEGEAAILSVALAADFDPLDGLSMGRGINREERADSLDGSLQRTSVDTMGPGDDRVGTSELRRQGIQAGRPADLDPRIGAWGDLESVLDTLADEIAASWSRKDRSA